MVDKKEILRQLKLIKFNYQGWGRSEASELPDVILPEEEIFEAVNGIYDGGFALLVATDIRVLLIDKKPLHYLTVEDMRYDMISEIDYSHRLIGAEISISSGEKNLHFRSYNKPRLRKLIGHVQHKIAANKRKQFDHQDSQVSHLEQINFQLQAYLLSQQQYQAELQKAIYSKNNNLSIPEPPRPSHELADYLYAKSLIKDYNQRHNIDLESEEMQTAKAVNLSEQEKISQDIYNEGVKEIFNNSQTQLSQVYNNLAKPIPLHPTPTQIAYSKLPLALRRRRFSKTPVLNRAISTVVKL